MNDSEILVVLREIASHTAPAPFNVGGALVHVFAASLGFVLALAMNEALSKSFSVVIPAPGVVVATEEEIGGAWIYAVVMLVVVILCLYLLMSCVRKWLVKKTSGLGCMSMVSRLKSLP